MYFKYYIISPLVNNRPRRQRPEKSREGIAMGIKMRKGAITTQTKQYLVPALPDFWGQSLSPLSILKIRWPVGLAWSTSRGLGYSLCEEHWGLCRRLVRLPRWLYVPQCISLSSLFFSPLYRNEGFGALPHTAPQSSCLLVGGAIGALKVKYISPLFVVLAEI